MAEELKGLIEKIKEEGIKAAEDKAKKIESEARDKANDTIDKAQKEASRIIFEAKENARHLEESTKTALQQTARDMILSLKIEMNSILDKITASHVQKALNAEDVSKLISSFIEENLAKGKDGVVISLKKEDLDKLEKTLLGELREELKKGITLKPSEDIHGGFRISYDGGKSHYDFSDRAIADYIVSYIRPKLADILKETK